MVVRLMPSLAQICLRVSIPASTSRSLRLLSLAENERLKLYCVPRLLIIDEIGYRA